jgi:K+-transporting ATPase ATPase C chain
MLQQLRAATCVLVAMTVLTGVLYPATVTLVAHMIFPNQATGSFLWQDDQVIGSELIGQSFSHPEYFWGRLSATNPVPYNASASSGSNFGPLHPRLRLAAKARRDALRLFDPGNTAIPIDLVTASASGLDPHISPAAAEFQVARIAAARKISEDDVRRLVQHHTEGRQMGILGESRVNVLKLNLALDQLQENGK